MESITNEDNKLVESTLDTCKKLVDNKMKDQVQKTYDILEDYEKIEYAPIEVKAKASKEFHAFMILKELQEEIDKIEL